MTTELETWKARALAAESLVASARDDADDDLSVLEEARSRAAAAEEALAESFAACSKAGVVFDDLARHDLPYAIGRLASDLSAIRAARDSAERERDTFRRIAEEGRAAGRAEAVAILLRQDAETFPLGEYENGGHPHALVCDYPIGDTGDYGTAWDPAAVLRMFDLAIDGTAMGSELERQSSAFDELYWGPEGLLVCGERVKSLESALSAERAKREEAESKLVRSQLAAIGGRADLQYRAEAAEARVAEVEMDLADARAGRDAAETHVRNLSLRLLASSEPIITQAFPDPGRKNDAPLLSSSGETSSSSPAPAKREPCPAPDCDTGPCVPGPCPLLPEPAKRDEGTRCETCGGTNEVEVKRVIGRRIQTCVEPCPRCRPTPDRKED